MDLLTLLVLAGAVGLIVLVWAALNPVPPFEFGDRGLRVRSLNWGWIRWDEIEGAYQPTAQDRDGLYMRLHVTERLARKVRRHLGLAAGAGLPDTVEVRLDLAGVDITPTELLREIVGRSGVQVERGLNHGLAHDA